MTLAGIRRNIVTPDGVRIVVEEVRGEGPSPAVYCAHATGFCGAVFRPLVALLRESAERIVTWDFRGHGSSGAATPPVSWWEMAQDAAAVRDADGVGAAVGVGHSMGGAALVMATLEDPGRFQRLVLVEPIIMPPPFRRTDHDLARLARKRRRQFDDRESARANFAGKPPFQRWHPDALDGYCEAGLIEDGSGVRLACDPEFEAEVYTAASAHGVVDLLEKVRIPVTVMMGSETDTYPRSWGEELAARFPDGQLRVVEGATHFLPMERPDLVAGAVLES